MVSTASGSSVTEEIVKDGADDSWISIPIESSHFLLTDTLALGPRLLLRSASLMLMKLVEPLGRPRPRFVVLLITGRRLSSDLEGVNFFLIKNELFSRPEF
jgi:hypothetical protein